MQKPQLKIINFYGKYGYLKIIKKNKLMCTFLWNKTRHSEVIDKLLILKEGGVLPLLPLPNRPDPPHPRKLEDQVRETIHDLILVVRHAQPRINKI